MAILFELSEPMVKRAALIASHFPDRSMLSIIEECFNHGANALYSVQPTTASQQCRKLIKESNTLPEPSFRNSLSELTGSIAKQARDTLDTLNKEEDTIEVIHSDSYADPIIGSNGMYEL